MKASLQECKQWYLQHALFHRMLAMQNNVWNHNTQCTCHQYKRQCKLSHDQAVRIKLTDAGHQEKSRECTQQVTRLNVSWGRKTASPYSHTCTKPADSTLDCVRMCSRHTQLQQQPRQFIAPVQATQCSCVREQTQPTSAHSSCIKS